MTKHTKDVQNRYDGFLKTPSLWEEGVVFNMNQFEKAIELFQKVIRQYPDATISILDGGNEFGKTAAKCHYALMNCFLGLGKVHLAMDVLNSLNDFPDSYLINESGEKVTFKELAHKALNFFTKSIK